MKKLTIFALFAVFVIAGFFLWKPVFAPAPSGIPTPIPSVSKPSRAEPISRASERVTKKPFGIHVTPKDSPVEPEKFTGYHTGVDFEVFEDEQTTDVPILAICDGPLVSKSIARGYGGMAVQRCLIDGSPPAVIVYGHLRLASITAKSGDILKAGEVFAVLGTGYSTETDGERKHLHLGIHRGTIVDTRGYVATVAELKKWIEIYHDN